MFVKFSPERKIAVPIVYVDDIILTGDCEEELLRMKKLLAKEFEIEVFLARRWHDQREIYLSPNVSMFWIY